MEIDDPSVLKEKARKECIDYLKQVLCISEESMILLMKQINPINNDKNKDTNNTNNNSNNNNSNNNNNNNDLTNENNNNTKDKSIYCHRCYWSIKDHIINHLLKYD